MSFDVRLDGKVALVTGASGGLGLHFAQRLAASGAKVALAARRVDKVQAAAEAIRQQGGQAFAVAMDVVDAGSIRDAFEDINAALGPVQILVNNAGVSPNKPMLQMDENDWDSTVDTNLKGPWLAAKEFAGRLVAAKLPGSIINIASILGKRVIAQVTPYVASKYGLVGLTEAMALEFARYNIRVNTIAPGYIETDLNSDFFASEAGKNLIKRIPQRRLGQAADLDGALLLLASDASSFMTGTLIAVDGGHLISSL